MDFEQFDRGMSSLENFYNRQLTDSQKDIWFKKIGSADFEIFKKSIDSVTNLERSFPTPKIIRDSIDEVMRHEVVTYVPVVECYDCRSSGWVSARMPGDKYITAFKCGCANGQRLSHNIKSWDEVKFSGYQEI